MWHADPVAFWADIPPPDPADRKRHFAAKGKLVRKLPTQAEIIIGRSRACHLTKMGKQLTSGTTMALAKRARMGGATILEDIR